MPLKNWTAIFRRPPHRLLLGERRARRRDRGFLPRQDGDDLRRLRAWRRLRRLCATAGALYPPAHSRRAECHRQTHAGRRFARAPELPLVGRGTRWTVLRHSGIERRVRAIDRFAAGESRGEVQCCEVQLSRQSRAIHADRHRLAHHQFQDAAGRSSSGRCASARAGRRVAARCSLRCSTNSSAPSCNPSAAITAPTTSRSPWSAARSTALSAGAGPA